MKIRPVGAESFHADGRTDMTKTSLVFAILQARLQTRQSSFWNHLHWNITLVLLSRDIKGDLGLEYHSVSLVFI